MKIVSIGGVPASGKTTLVKRLREMLGKPKLFKFRKLRGEYYKEDSIYLLGVYDDKLFSGTDRLSMAVQPDVIKFLTYIKENSYDSIIVFEGDRLFNKSFIESIRDIADSKIYLLQVDEEELEKRHIKRNDTQSEKWLKGRITKIQNIIDKYGKQIELMSNKDEEELENNVRNIWQSLRQSADPRNIT